MASEHRETRPPRWAGPDARAYVATLDGARLAWVQAGTGPPLLLLHGFGGSGRWWVRNLAMLARRHAVYALDLPGFGASRLREPYSFERSMDVIAAWMDRLGLAGVSVVAHSMGGQLAMLLAARHPERVGALVLIAPAGVPFHTNMLGTARDAFRSRMGGDMRFTPIVVLGSLRAGPLVMWQAARQITAVDVRPRIGALAVPTLIIWGDRDRLLPVANAAVLAEAMPGARLMIVPGASHNLFYDSPALVNEAIADFLAAEAPSGR